MRSFLVRSVKTAINLRLFLVVWSLAAIVSVLLFFNVFSDHRVVYLSIASICYPILIVAVVLDLDVWHNRQVISAAITRGRSRLYIVCTPFFYLFLSHIIFYAVLSFLFMPGGISKLAMLQYALPQAGLTAWIMYISFATDKRIVAATAMLIYLYFVSPFIPIIESAQLSWVNALPGYVRSMISLIAYMLPPVWSVGGPVVRDSLMSAELLGKCLASTLLPLMAAYRLFKAKDI